MWSFISEIFCTNYLCKFSRNWLNEAKGLCSPEHLKEFSLGNLEKEINLLEKELSTESQEIGFCHNDMQYGNIMINENTRAITIIVSVVGICLLKLSEF